MAFRIHYSAIVTDEGLWNNCSKLTVSVGVLCQRAALGFDRTWAGTSIRREIYRLRGLPGW